MRILLIDDQMVIRQGLKMLLQAEPDIQVVGMAENGKVGVELVEKLQPDVALIDMYMPVMDGAAATRIICQQFPTTKVVLLSSSNEDECIAAALEAGALGYLLKDSSAEDLANAIRSANKGYTQLGPGLLNKAIANVGSASSSVPQIVELTEIEMEGLRLLKSSNRFDVRAIDDLLLKIKSSDIAMRLYAHVETQLKHQPDHLVSLYLAGTLLHKFQNREREALNYLKFGFICGSEKGLSFAGLFLFCREAFYLGSDEALTWLKQVLLEWPQEQPPSILFQQAAQIFEANSLLDRIFLVMWQITAINTFTEEVQFLQTRIESLNAGLEQLMGS